MLETFDAWIRSVGPAGYAVLCLAALIEYVFPPFPGDTITLLGGAYAVRAGRSLALVVLVLTLGSAAGIIATWRAGLAVSGSVAALDADQRLFGLRVRHIRRAQELMRERGGWLLLVNRFLPSFRAVLFVAAGASGVPLSRALALGLVSALGWNVLLVAAGAALGANAEAIEGFLLSYRRVALLTLGAVALILTARFAWRRWRGRERSS